MYRSYDMVNGLPPRIYRAPSEVRRDIAEISEKIEAVNDMLNIRSLLIDVLMSEGASSAEKIIPELEEVVNEARYALEKLRSLKEDLNLLEEELEEVRCLVKT